jgi:hypothetical protein
MNGAVVLASTPSLPPREADAPLVHPFSIIRLSQPPLLSNFEPKQTQPIKSKFPSEMNAPYASLATSARSQELKKARGILWFVGIITILFQGFLFVNARDELDKAIDAELSKNGTSLSAIKALPAEERAEFEKEYTSSFGKVRLIYGAGMALGVIFILCALSVNRKPVAATVTGLVLYLGNLAVQAAIDPSTIVQGIIIKFIIIVGLISAVKAALAIEKEGRSHTTI